MAARSNATAQSCMQLAMGIHGAEVHAALSSGVGGQPPPPADMIYAHVTAVIFVQRVRPCWRCSCTPGGESSSMLHIITSSHHKLLARHTGWPSRTYLEAHTRNITHGVAAATESGNQNLILRVQQVSSIGRGGGSRHLTPLPFRQAARCVHSRSWGASKAAGVGKPCPLPAGR